MATSPKRYGLEVIDLELELRLRRMEADLARATLISDFADSDNTKRLNVIPQVTGLRVVGSTSGAVTVAWSQVPISDLKRYELDIAEDLAFSINKQEFNVANLEHQFSTVSATGGGGGTVIFARVRARSKSDNVGPYSIVLNTTTGQAQTEDIADAAVTDANLDSSATLLLSLEGYISGLRVANGNPDSVNDIDFNSGIARDADNTASIEITSLKTKRIDDPWGLGSDVGGFPSITLTDDTWYGLFVIAQRNNLSITDAGFDSETDASNLIAAAEAVNSGWANALYRQVGWVQYFSATGIRQFHQFDNDLSHIIYDEAVLVDTGIGIAIEKLVDMPVPPNTEADFTYYVFMPNPGGSDFTEYSVVVSTAVSDDPITINNADFRHEHRRRRGEKPESNQWKMRVHVDSDSQIRTRWESGTSILEHFRTRGYYYYRGRG